MKNEKKSSVKMTEMDIQNPKVEEKKGKKRGRKPKMVLLEEKPEVPSEPIREEVKIVDSVEHYNRGYKEGKKAGYEDGWKNAHRQGYEEGYDAAQKEAYRAAYEKEEYEDTPYSSEDDDLESMYTDDDYEEEEEYDEEDDDDGECEKAETEWREPLYREGRSRIQAFNREGTDLIQFSASLMDTLYAGMAVANVLAGIELFMDACSDHNPAEKGEALDLIGLGLEMYDESCCD